MKLSTLVFLLVCKKSLTQSQFFLSKDDGSYKYGYGGVEQTADAFNQVSGKYFYKNALGEDVEVKYTAGVEGFVPSGSEQTDSDSEVIESASELPQEEPVEDEKVHEETTETVSTTTASPEQTHGSFNPDGSYAFFYASKDSTRQEFADSNNNVLGKYSYSDGETKHDLSYSAGANTGFVVTGGSLAQPNGLRQSPESAIFYQPRNHDGSYSFEFSTPTQSRHEIADSKGNVYGGYSFENEGGFHDLRYVAGSETGFLPVGGSLWKGAKGRKTDEETPQPAAKNADVPLSLSIRDQLLFLLNNPNHKGFGYFYIF